LFSKAIVFISLCLPQTNPGHTMACPYYSLYIVTMNFNFFLYIIRYRK